MPQHLQALALANEVRLFRREVQRQLRTREINFSEVDFDHAEIQRMPLRDLLKAVPYQRRATGSRAFDANRLWVLQLLRELNLPPHIRISGLSAGRRAEVVAAVERWAPSQRRRA